MRLAVLVGRLRNHEASRRLLVPCQFAAMRKPSSVAVHARVSSDEEGTALGVKRQVDRLSFTLVVVGALGLFGCGDGDTTSESTTTLQAASTTASESSTSTESPTTSDATTTTIAVDDGCVDDAQDTAGPIDVAQACIGVEGADFFVEVTTYAPFADEQFRNCTFNLDADGDGVIEIYVNPGFRSGRFTAHVGGDDGIDLAETVIARPTDNSLRVTFPFAALGSPDSMAWTVTCVSDLGGGVSDPNNPFDNVPDESVGALQVTSLP